MAHIRKRGKRFSVVTYEKVDGINKQKWYSGFKSWGEAERFVESGCVRAPLLKDFMSTWLRDKAIQIRPGTMRSYKWLMESHIFPEFGQTSIDTIKAMDIQSFYTKLNDKGLSNQSIINTHRLLKQALEQAKNFGYINANPASLVKPPRQEYYEFSVWTPEHIKDFLNTARTDTRYFIFFLLAVSTGMRLGELLALRWDDLNLKYGNIWVRRTYSYTGKGYVLQSPKTKKGIRSISLSPTVIHELINHQKKQAVEKSTARDWVDNNLIICTANGTPVLQHNLRYTLQKIVSKSGVPVIRIHDLRHTHATLLLQQGIHPKVVQERLGHEDIDTTLNIYSHVLPSMQSEVAIKFESILAPIIEHKN